GGVHHGVHEVLELVDLLVGDALDHPRGDRDLEHLPRLGDLGDGHHAGPQHQLEDVAAAAVEGGGDQYVAAALHLLEHAQHLQAGEPFPHPRARHPADLREAALGGDQDPGLDLGALTDEAVEELEGLGVHLTSFGRSRNGCGPGAAGARDTAVDVGTMQACELGGGNRPTPPPCGSADDQRWSRGCPASENWSTILSQGPRRTTRGTLVRPMGGRGRASELHRWRASWNTALPCSCRTTDGPTASARSETGPCGPSTPT